MIIYGIRGKIIQGQPIKDFPCPHCENEAHISFGVIQYFHIYWIPTFMYAKKVGLECLHCRNTVFDKELPQDLYSQLSPKLFNNGNVLPMFSGLAIIFLLILYFALFG